MTSDVLVHIENHMMKLTLNRPDSLNAINKEMVDIINESLDEAKGNSNIRIITIAGAGRAFSAGGDIKNMKDRSGLEVYENLTHVNELIKKIRTIEKPVISLIHGYAIGIAFSISLACDFILAEEDSDFIMSFSKVGLSSDGGSSFLLSRLVGAQRAKELLFLAKPLNAQQAYEWGIVNRVYSPGKLLEQSQEFINELARGPSKSYAMIKNIVNQSLNSSLGESLDLERLTQSIMVSTNDHKEAVSAFNEKRKANFTGS